MKREDKRAWQDKSLQIIERMRGICDDDIFFKLAQAQILLVQNRSDEAGWLIDNVRDFLEENKDSHVELYCYYLYVSAMYYKDKSYTFAAVKVIRDYYENGYDTWRSCGFYFIWTPPKMPIRALSFCVSKTHITTAV